MKLKSSNRIEENRYELEIEIGAEEFEKEVEKIYKRDVKKINVPGFRKGKAPRKFIEKYYGENVFYEDAVNNLYPYAIDDAAKEANLELVDDKIDLDIVEIGKNGLVFKATVTVTPEVSIGEYRGIEVKVEKKEVTEEDLEKEIKKVQERNSRLITVEGRPAQTGDTAVIDFEGFIDGVAFAGGKGENHNLELGSGHFIPGFEEQVAGHNVEEEFDVNVKFPEEYHAEEFKGKDAVFKVKIHEIKTRELPEIDDEFVKDISEFDTLDDYKKDLKEKLIENCRKQEEAEAENQMVDKLIALVEAEIPEAMIKSKVKENVGDFSYRLQSQGMDLKSYLKYTGMDEDKLGENFRPQAENQVKLRLALEKIAEIENIVPTEEELEEEYKKVAEHYKIDVDRVKAFVPRDSLLKDIASEKAINIVREARVNL